jgi:hypothetical protein
VYPRFGVVFGVPVLGGRVKSNPRFREFFIFVFFDPFLSVVGFEDAYFIQSITSNDDDNQLWIAVMY